jgi:hypothetical protein
MARPKNGCFSGHLDLSVLHVDWPLTASEETMSYFARLRGRDSRRRPSPARYVVEALEGRTLLSGTAAASPAPITSVTVLKSEFSTAVTGAKIIFTASVENASNDAPIGSGKVEFVVQSPKKIVLGDVKLDKQGQASILTSALTQIGNYTVEAQFTPSSPDVSRSAGPALVNVIPVPLNVPTVTTIQSGASSAEVGQFVPLVATVKDAGTGAQVNAGLVEPVTGTVEFLTDSPDPVVVGEVALSKTGRASVSTDMLRNIGPYQIEAKFFPAFTYFTGSTSAPTGVTITPTTVNAPTVTSLQAVANSVESGESIALNATVQYPNSSLPDGIVKFVTVSPHPVVLGEVNASAFGQQISFTTAALEKPGTYQIEAQYLPSSNRFAESISPPVTVTVTPLTAASFRVTPVVRHGHLGKPMSFIVTALNAEKQPLRNYAGTVVFSSPTDSWTIFPAAVYIALNTAPPPANSPILATFTPQSYTFSPEDHGSKTFVGAVTFGKGGAETLTVTQANNPKVFGRTTFAIG